MAWGCHLRALPSVYSYAHAKSVWERAPTPRTRSHVNNGWSETNRPLDDFRKTHYAVQRVTRNEREEYDFFLYRTRVVCWRGLSTVTINAKWDSTATNNFLYQFTGFASIRHHNNYCDGHKRVLHVGDKQFLPGELTFEKKGDTWECVSDYEKPMREVLHPALAASVRKSMEPWVRWTKGIYAMLPPETPHNHPWVGEAKSRCAPNLSKLEDGDMDAFVSAVIRFSRFNGVIKNGVPLMYCAAPTLLNELLSAAREHYYTDYGCYIAIPYDEPIPGRSK